MVLAALNLLSPAIISYLFESIFLTVIGCIKPNSFIEIANSEISSTLNFFLGWFGLKSISSAVETMAEHEGLDAHKNAVSIRINSNES